MAEPSNMNHNGGAKGTRTPDPLHAMQVRYQLRHSPVFRPNRIETDPRTGDKFTQVLPQIANPVRSPSDPVAAPAQH